MTKYYFVSFELRMIGTSNWVKSNTAISVHPTVWLWEMFSTSPDRYVITFWEEITEQQYTLVNGRIY